jgi:N-terminal domain of Peptidase_S41 in eukaryotic IRBP
MQQADITSIARELAALVAERYVFPGLAAEISQHLESRLAEGCYGAMPDEESLATAVTRDLQSLNGDQHLRLLHSAAELPERGDEAAELAAMSAYATVRRAGSPGLNGSTATSVTSTCGRCCSPGTGR